MFCDYIGKISKWNSWGLYTVSSIFAIIFYKYDIISVLIFAIFFVIYLVRIVYAVMRNSKINSIIYDGDTIDYSESKKVCADNCADVVAMIVYVIMLLSKNPQIAKLLISDNITLVLFYSLIYFIFVYYSIKNDYVILKICTLLCSTIQGVMFLLVMITIPLRSLVYSMENQKLIIETIPIDRDSFCSSIIIIGHMLEKHPLYTFIPLIISIILYTVYICMSPGFQLGKIKIAMQIVNILIVTISIIMFFGADYLNVYVNQFKKSIMLGNNNNYDFKGKAWEIEILKYIKNFETVNIKNLLYLLVVPYSGGILYANLIVELKIRYIKKKTNTILENMIDNKKIENKERKRYFYYGGDKIHYKLCRKLEDEKDKED